MSGFNERFIFVCLVGYAPSPTGRAVLRIVAGFAVHAVPGGACEGTVGCIAADLLRVSWEREWK